VERVVDEASLLSPFVRRKIIDELTEPEALDTLRRALATLIRAGNPSLR
jgi:hypothetical protein